VSTLGKSSFTRPYSFNPLNTNFRRPATFETFLKLLLLPRALTKAGEADDEEITVVDLEESGYQASFSKLGASEPLRRDPVPQVNDPGVFMAQQLAECSARHPGQIGGLLQAVPQEMVQHFKAIMSRESLQLS
jgi:exportin-2 (importin alpha re-exporter)